MKLSSFKGVDPEQISQHHHKEIYNFKIIWLL